MIFVKKPFASHKSLAEKYWGLFLLIDAKTNSVRLGARIFRCYSHEPPWSNQLSTFCHQQHSANITAHEALVIKAGERMVPISGTHRFHDGWFTWGSAYWTPCSPG